MSESENIIHLPVLLKEVGTLLNPGPGKIMVDATIGLGGHSELLIELIQPGGRLIGLDCDKEALQLTKQRLKPYGSQIDLFCDNFVCLNNRLDSLGISQADGILLDLGLSSYQLGHSRRGFSLQTDGPLDMRMNQSSPLRAERIVNQYRLDDLIRIFWEYGEERWSRRIARAIVRTRSKRRIQTTSELVEIILRSIPTRANRQQRLHPATRIFQALRIEVNKELNNLSEFLKDSETKLATGGRMGIISFHSLEDRLVKQAFREKSKQGILKIITPKPIRPSQEERLSNPQSRSARFRVAEKS